MHEVYSICCSSPSVRPLRLFVNRTLLTNLLYPGALAFFFDILTPFEGKSVDEEGRTQEVYVTGSFGTGKYSSSVAVTDSDECVRRRGMRC